jgi:hypothetical protein
VFEPPVAKLKNKLPPKSTSAKQKKRIRDEDDEQEATTEENSTDEEEEEEETEEEKKPKKYTKKVRRALDQLFQKTLPSIPPTFSQAAPSQPTFSQPSTPIQVSLSQPSTPTQPPDPFQLTSPIPPLAISQQLVRYEPAIVYSIWRQLTTNSTNFWNLWMPRWMHGLMQKSIGVCGNVNARQILRIHNMTITIRVRIRAVASRAIASRPVASAQMTI